MADHELNLCPIWDITQSHTLAFLKYEPAMVDFSITLGGGQFGVAFALFDPAAFSSGNTSFPNLRIAGHKRSTVLFATTGTSFTKSTQH